MSRGSRLIMSGAALVTSAGCTAAGEADGRVLPFADAPKVDTPLDEVAFDIVVKLPQSSVGEQDLCKTAAGMALRTMKAGS